MNIDKEYEEKMISFEIDCFDGKGVPEACHEAAYFQQVIRNNKVQAVKMFDKNCDEKGYLLSCFNAARLHASGRSIPQNLPRATQQFKRACEGEVIPACFFYGSILMSEPDKTIEERKNGLDILVNACRKNEVQSCYSAASYYISKANPDRNPKLAQEFLQIACDRYHTESCHNLAVMYHQGDEGVEPNKELFEKYKKMTLKMANEQQRFHKIQNKLKEKANQT